MPQNLREAQTARLEWHRYLQRKRAGNLLKNKCHLKIGKLPGLCQVEIQVQDQVVQLAWGVKIHNIEKVDKIEQYSK